MESSNPGFLELVLGDLVGLAFLCAMVVLTPLLLFAQWRMFEKAGKPGWASLVPFYQWWCWMEIIGLPGYFMFGLLIPILNLVLLVVWIYRIPVVFGRSSTWGCLCLLPLVNIFVFPLVYLSIGFGDAKYQGRA